MLCEGDRYRLTPSVTFPIKGRNFKYSCGTQRFYPNMEYINILVFPPFVFIFKYLFFFFNVEFLIRFWLFFKNRRTWTFLWTFFFSFSPTKHYILKCWVLFLMFTKIFSLFYFSISKNFENPQVTEKQSFSMTKRFNTYFSLCLSTN